MTQTGRKTRSEVYADGAANSDTMPTRNRSRSEEKDNSLQYGRMPPSISPLTVRVVFPKRSPIAPRKEVSPNSTASATALPATISEPPYTIFSKSGACAVSPNA